MADETPEDQTPIVDTAPDPNTSPALEDAPDLTVEEIFNFDPFGPDGTPNVPESERIDPETGTGVQDQAAPGAEAAPPPEGEVVTTGGAPQPPPAPVVDPREERLRVLEEQNKQLLEFLARGQQQQQTPPVAAKPAEPKPEEYPNYMFQVPQQIRDMLLSEDPNVAQQGLAALIAGMGRTVHEQVRQEFRNELQNRITSFREQFIADQQRASQAQQVYNDFYGTFPQFNRPELRGVVEAATRAVVAEEKATGWSASLRDKIGARVVSIIQNVSQSGAPQAESGVRAPATPTPSAGGNGARKPTPPRMRGTSTRPTPETPPAPGSQEAHMIEVLKGIH